MCSDRICDEADNVSKYFLKEEVHVIQMSSFKPHNILFVGWANLLSRKLTVHQYFGRGYKCTVDERLQQKKP